MKRIIAFLCAISMLIASFAFPVSATVDTASTEPVSAASTEVKVPEVGVDFSTRPNYMSLENPTHVPYTMETWVYNTHDVNDTTWIEGNIFGNKMYDKTKSFSFRFQNRNLFLTLDLAGAVDDIQFQNTRADYMVWTHLAMTVDLENSLITTYKNGKKKESHALTAEEIEAINAVNFTDEDCDRTQLGGVFSWDNAGYSREYVRGQIGYFAAYSDVRSADEIAADYLDYTDPDKDNLLVAYIPDGNDESPIIEDISGNDNDATWSKKPLGYVSELSLPTDYDYSMFVIGDTQSLSNKTNTSGFSGLYDWIADNAEAKNMQAVIGVGDITDDNIASQYDLALENFAKLDGKVIHLPIHGNHDISTDYGGDNAVLYKDYAFFDANENSESRDGSIHAYYQKFYVGEQKFLFLGLSYGHTREDRAWAADIIEANPDHNVIISTHAYLGSDGMPLTYDGAPALHDELIEPYSNVVLVLCGHMHNDNVLLYTEKRDDGSTVQAVLTNPQVFNQMVNAGVATGLYFTNGGKKVYVANHLVGTDTYLGTESVRSFKLDLLEDRGEANVPEAGADFTGLPPYSTQQAPSAIPHTVEAWVYSAKSNWNSNVIGNMRDGAKGKNTFNFTIESRWPALYFGALVADGAEEADYKIKFTEQSSRIGDNEWIHVALTVDTENKAVSLYKNGTLSETKTMTDAMVNAWNTISFSADNNHTKYTVVGGRMSWSGTVTKPYAGQIASVAAYSDVRSADEVYADYLDYKDPDKTDLVFAYAFDGNKSAEYADLSDNKNDLSWAGFTYKEANEVEIPDAYDYSMMVVGDIQTLTENDSNVPLNSLFEWINANAAQKKTAAIIGVGDMTDDNTDAQWAKVVEAYSKLDGTVPHLPTFGNHDLKTSSDQAADLYKSYITLDKVSYTDSYDGSIEAYYYKFAAGGRSFIYLAVGYKPTSAVREWAADVIESNPDCNVIISTHAYLNEDGSLIAESSTGYVRQDLVLPYSNVVLVLCGHMHTTDVRLYTETRADGSTVQAMLTNQQDFSMGGMPYGVVTELYFTEGGTRVSVANRITGLNVDRDVFLGGESISSFTLDLAELPEKELVNAVTAESFSVRMDEYTGLRGIFSFDVSSEAAMAEQGLTLKSYGVIAASYDKLMNTYSGNEDALFAAARAAGDDKGAVKFIPVYNADGTGKNRYLDYSAREFCVSLTNIPSDRSLADIYMAGYVIWVDELGNEYHTLATYAMDDGVKAVNLYEITLGLTKTGVINSENTDDICFWQVLRNGALKTDSFGTVIDGATNNYSYDADGYFTYCDVDWYAYSSISNTDGWSFAAGGVSETASGVVWSVLKYTEDEYVLILRNRDKENITELKIPQSAMGNNVSGNRYYAPYDYRYGQTSNSNTATNVYYNPPIAQADYNKIKTFVVDHGITGTAASAFAGLAVDTLVYPNGMETSAGYLFNRSATLSNVIWCHEAEGEDGELCPVEHMSEFNAELPDNQKLKSLVDLRGMGGISLNSAFSRCTAMENVVVGGYASSVSKLQSTFYNSELIRFWSADTEMPASGVIDISGATSVKTLDKGVFAASTSFKTIKLPSSITTITQKVGSSDYDRILGNGRSFNYICSKDVQRLIAEHVKYLQDNSVTKANKITVNDTAVTTLIAALG